MPQRIHDACILFVLGKRYRAHVLNMHTDVISLLHKRYNTVFSVDHTTRSHVNTCGQC